MSGDKVEEASNNGMTSYYGVTFLLFIALSVNCGMFFGKYNSITCIARDISPIPQASDLDSEETTEADDATRRLLGIDSKEQTSGLSIFEYFKSVNLDPPRFL